jgi:predicted ATP-grasp superfamily ATP-dependent carboligase
LAELPVCAEAAKMKILVTDGDNRAGLAITRSLGRAGHFVISAAPVNQSLAGMSRYCRRRFVYPNPLRDPGGFCIELLRFVQKEKPDVLMPVSEVTTILVTRHMDILGRHCRIPFPTVEVVQNAADKAFVLELARRSGVPVPDTVILTNPSELARKKSSINPLGFPLVVKPARSRFLVRNQWKSGGTMYATDKLELYSILERMLPQAYPLLVQRRVVGPGVGIFFLANQGNVVSMFSHRRIREKPPSGGVSVLRESYPIDPRIADYSRRLVEALKWHGVGMVEFKKDNALGDYRLMEINGRFWGSLQLAIDAGVDFPLKLLQLASGEEVNPDFNYRLGVKTRWFWGDFDALLMRLVTPDRKLKLPPGVPGRIRYLMNFLALHSAGQKFEVLNIDDFRPWLFETLSWLRGNLLSAFGKICEVKTLGVTKAPNGKDSNQGIRAPL